MKTNKNTAVRVIKYTKQTKNAKIKYMPVRFINIYLKITILKTFNSHTTVEIAYKYTTSITKEERKKLSKQTNKTKSFIYLTKTIINTHTHKNTQLLQQK